MCNIVIRCSPGETLGEISRLSDGINTLIGTNAKIEKLGEGFIWSEGPIWVKQNDFLLFTDVPGNIIYKWSEGEGVSEFLNPSGFAGADPSHLREAGANGLTLDGLGNLIMCDSGTRAVAAYDFKTKIKTSVVDSYQGKKLNSPNDVIVHSNGDIYFTDPAYGLKGINDSPVKELAFSGVYKFSKENGLTLLTDEFVYPNGIAFSPDENILYVSQSDPQNAILKAFDVQEDGTIINGRVLYDATEMVGSNNPGLPDGMAIDVSGNIFLTGPGGILVLTPEGKLLGSIITGTPISNCTFGNDGSVLYMTAEAMLCSIQTKTIGLRF